MQRDLDQPDGEPDPLDAALGDVQDLAELERRFALLDAHLDSGGPDVFAGPVAENDDPFADLAAVIREQQALLDDDEQGDADDDDADDDSSAAELDEIAVEIEQLCHDALDALDAGETQLARDTAMVAVKLDDEHPFPTFVLGLIAERQGDLDTARDMADLALGTAATNPDAIGLRAHIHVRQHEFEEAERLLRFGIAHNPDDALLHEGLARISLARGHNSEALESAAIALRIEPDNPGALAVRSAALDEGADRTALLAALRQGVQLHPEDPYSMLELASVEMEHGNLERARALLLRAQRLAPRDSEISDVRAMVEHVTERPLLRPVPALLRWLRDFPGGMTGFLAGFLIAALPLHALAVAQPQYRPVAFGIIALWGAVALYAWLAPAVLTRSVNRRSAHTAYERTTALLTSPAADSVDLARLADTAAMLTAARRRAQVVQLVELAARHTDNDDVRDALLVLGRRLRGVSARVRSALRFVPGLARMSVVVALACAVLAPLLADASGLGLLIWHALALTSLAFAWLILLVERAEARDIDDAFTAIGLAEHAVLPPRRRS